MNITIQNLSKSYGGRDIFHDFSLHIVDGMRLCVCGPNMPSQDMTPAQ